MQKKQTEDYTKFSGLDELMKIQVMKNYNSFIVNLAANHFKDVKKMVDFGAGIGTMSLILKESYSITPLCIEIDEVNKSYLSKKGFPVFNTLSSISEDIDFIFSSNVLEHIEDDISILREMKNILSDNGKLFLYLPARMILWSKLDEEVGHYRRYELNEIKSKCESVGLNVKSLHYADSIGFFAALSMRIIGYNKNSGLGSVPSLRFYDKWLLPMSKFFDNIGFKYLFGKNIVLIASKN